MAEAAARGARSEVGIEVQLLHAAEAGGAELLAADGYLFITPENLAAISGVMKDFFDRSYYAALDRINARPYASLICAGLIGPAFGLRTYFAIAILALLGGLVLWLRAARRIT